MPGAKSSAASVLEDTSLKHVPGAAAKMIEDVEDRKRGFFWCRDGRHGFTCNFYIILHQVEEDEGTKPPVEVPGAGY